MARINFLLVLLLIHLFAIVISSLETTDDPEQNALRSVHQSPLHRKLQRQIQAGTNGRKKKKNANGANRNSKKRRRPGRKQLDKSSLLGLMGDDFKSPWMTYDRPKKPMISVPSHEVVNLDEIPGRWAHKELEEEMQNLNLTDELASLTPELLPHASLIREFMLKRSACPIEFSWKDLGPKYWPRWVRKGDCKNRKGYCSFPPGMNCVPGATTVVHLLFWHCDKPIRQSRSYAIEEEGEYFVEFKRPVPEKSEGKKRNKRKGDSGVPQLERSILYKKRVPHLPSRTPIVEKKKRCDWRKVPYPITVDCFCAC